MKNKLDEIMAWKREEIARLAPHASELRKLALRRDEFRGFRSHLLGHEPALIAEVKRASPSAGLIAPDFRPVDQAREYERGHAHALSVLTDEKYFQGHLQDLRDVREQVALPVLRKDFIVHRHQLWEATVSGADCILLIVAGLDPATLEDLYKEACDLQLDVLVEVHDLREMDRALDLGSDMIGINNRNLQTFEVSLETTVTLSEEVPGDCVLVSESGIRTRDDVRLLLGCGVNALLVGEALMRANNIPAKIAELLALEQ
jgi:indole-3-glycerol phosphate synthase